MKKRLMMIIMIFVIIISAVPAFAYKYAENTYLLSFDYIEEMEKAELTDNGIMMATGGTAKFKFLPPFNISGLAVTAYDYGAVSVKVTIDGETRELKGSGMARWDFDKVVRKKDLEVILEATARTTISNVEVIREDRNLPVGKGMTLMDIPDEEYNLQTAAVFMADSSAYIANSAVRYVDYNNQSRRVELINGSMYAPVSALAIGLSLYREEIPEEQYALLRRDNSMELFCKGDYAHYRYNDGERVVIKNPAVYKDGTIYLPVRYIAELFGETVEYKDGFAVIDNKYSARNIMNSDAMVQYIKTTLTDFCQKNTDGKTYYVAQTKNASDKNDGSEAAPFKTLSKAGEVVKAGDTVIVGGGIYRETLTIANNGEKARPITFRAKEGEKPVISALEKVQGFATYPSDEVMTDNVVVAQLKTTLGEGRNMVFMNNISIAEGRHPNTDTSEKAYIRKPMNLSDMWPTEGNMKIRVATDEEKANNTKILDVISETDLNQSENFWEGATYIGFMGAAWGTCSGKIKSSVPGMISMDPENVSYFWFDDQWQAENLDDCGYITNHIRTVDAPGEWYIDEEEKLLYICPPEGTTIDTMKLETKARQLVIDLKKNSYITFDGFETIGGGIRMNDGVMNVFNNCDFRYVSHFSYFHDNRDGYLENFDDRFEPEGGAPQRGEAGIYVGGDNNVIVNCRIDHSAGAGIYSTGAYGLFENNHLIDCGYNGGDVSGIFLSGKAYLYQDGKRGGDVIYYNTIDRVGRSTIHYANQHDQDTNPMTGSIPLDIGYNDLNNGMVFGRDGALIYTHGMSLGSDNRQSKVHHNSIRNIWNSQNWGGSGVYHDNITLFQEVYDNLIFNENGMTYSELIFTHPAGIGNPYWGVIDEWNNTQFSKYTGKLEDINPSDYPGGKPFRTGSSLVNGIYRENIDNPENDYGWYTTEDISDMSDASIKDGMASFDEVNGWIEFRDVDFGEQSNLLQIYYAADKYNKGDKVRVIVGDSLENGRKTLAVLNSVSPYTDSSMYLGVGIGKISGKQNVYIQATDIYSASVKKIKPGYDKDAVYSVYTFWADELTRLIESNDPNSVGPPRFSPIPHNTQHKYINATWDNTVLIYEDIEILNECDTIKWEAAVSESNAGEFEVYLDSLDSEPVAKASVTPLGWGNYLEESVETLRPIKPGKYDVYIKFVGVGKTEDWCYLSFCNTAHN